MTKWILIWVIYMQNPNLDDQPVAVTSGTQIFNSEEACEDAGTIVRANAGDIPNDVTIWTRCFKK